MCKSADGSDEDKCLCSMLRVYEVYIFNFAGYVCVGLMRTTMETAKVESSVPELL